MTMKTQHVKITSIRSITHDVLQFDVEKPTGFSFIPGQATEIAIDKEGWRTEKRPFTFTNLPHESHLEFTIKTYPGHHGVTNELLQLKQDDGLILHDVFGAIAYKHEGLFIAGGAGVTPFISIFRHLQFLDEIGSNKLIVANKTEADIILKSEFQRLLGKRFVSILSDERVKDVAHGFMTSQFLKAQLPDGAQNIYVCGPPPMMDAVVGFLAELHVDEKSIIKESV